MIASAKFFKVQHSNAQHKCPNIARLLMEYLWLKKGSLEKKLPILIQISYIIPQSLLTFLHYWLF